MKASDFQVGERVRDIDVVDTGTVASVADNKVTVDFDNGEEFTFEEGIDLEYLAKGEAA